jgi:hypothetical protein
MRFRRTARILAIAALALGLAGCSTEDPVEAETLVETLVNIAGVAQDDAQCAADIIFGTSSGFTEDQIKEAEADLASVEGFEDFAIGALQECGAIPTLAGPTPG